MNPHKHGWTQGPWTHAEGSRTGAVWAGKDFIASVYPNAPEGWDGFSPYAEEAECKANACLVAASPELYEALEKIRDLTKPDQALGISDAIELICDVWNISSAALSKAKAPAEGEGG